MLFQISYSLIRASPVLMTCFYFDFSLHFATFVYTFILCVFSFICTRLSYFPVCYIPSFILTRFISCFLNSYPHDFSLLKFSFLLSPYVYFLPLSLLFFFINSSLYVCFFYTTIFLSIFFIDSFLSDDFHSFFSLHLCFFHSRFCPFFCHCLFSIPHQGTAWFPYCHCNKCHAILNHISYGTHFSLCL